MHVDSQKASSIKWFHTFFCRWPFFCSTNLMVSQMREIFLSEKPNFKNCCLVSVGLYWKRSRSTYTQTNYNRASMHNYGCYNTIFLCKCTVKRQTENTIMCHRRLTGVWINGSLGSTYINLVCNISLTLKSVSVNLRSVLPVSSNPDATSCSFKGGEKVVREKLNIGRTAEGSPWERLREMKNEPFDIC